MKNTLWAEWTMTDIQVLRKRRAGLCVQHTGDTGTQYAPGLTKVIETKEYAVCHPIPLAKHAIHLGQQGSAKKELFPQESVKYCENNKQAQKPPGVH